jgi:hypothetical protein
VALAAVRPPHVLCKRLAGIAARPLRKTPLFSQLSLCLSRACLGKMIVVIYKWLKKWRVFLTDVAPSEMCKTIEAVSACENTAAGDSPPLPVLSRATFDSFTGVPARNTFFAQPFPCLSRACLRKTMAFLCKRGSEEAFFAPVTRSHAVLVSPLIAKCSVVISPATAGVTTTQRLVVVLPP